MPLTVAELARDLGLRLAAGHAGAQAPVRWVHISNLADPTPWLTGGELLLTTGAGDDHDAYVERLVAHGLAGLGLGTGFDHDVLPAALCAAADRLGFPVLEVPYEVPFIAVTEHAGRQLVNEHYAVLRRAQQAHERLEAVLLAEGGLPGLAGALAALLGAPGGAGIFGPRGEPLAHAGLDGDRVAALAADVSARARAGGSRAFVPSGEPAGRALVLPVRRAPEAPDAPPQAWLAGVAAGAAPSELDRLVLRQATTVVALELLRRSVADATTRRLAGDVLGTLIAGELAGAELARRLEPFGLRGRVGALVTQTEASGRDRVEDALTAALRAEAVDGLVAGAGRFACALLPADDDVVALAERIRARAEERLGRPLLAGAGRGQPAGQARRAFLEARCALEAAALTGNPPALATFADLGSFQLLLALQDEEALRLFCDALLAPIESGEGAYGGELMKSLEIFIECNGQWERAAKQLFVHRHTLRYRIRRIEELTGRSLDSARDRIEFWLALRARELVR